MEILLDWSPVFLAGMALGILIKSLLPRQWPAKKRRTELVNARARVLAGVKEKHEQEILREIFQATDALRGELNKSHRRLLDVMDTLLLQVDDDSKTQNKTPTLRLSESNGSGRPPS